MKQKAWNSNILYRKYNSTNELLYIGISENNSDQRHRFHQTNQPWADEIAYTVEEVFENLDELKIAEKAAIRNEHPKYNIQDNAPVYEYPLPPVQEVPAEPEPRLPGADLEDRMEWAAAELIRAKIQLRNANTEAAEIARAAYKAGISEVRIAKKLGVDRARTLRPWIGKTTNRNKTEKVVGDVAIPANAEIPQVGDVIEVRYLHATSGEWIANIE